MKKLFYSLFALAMTVMTFTSCEDVPMPYDDPNKNPGGAETEQSVEPAGSGTAEDPYNVAAIIELVQGMEAGVESTQDYYFKGKISAITEEYSSQYGNGTFYISDDGNNSSTRFYVFRALYLNNKRFADGNEQIKIGDEVVICGKVTNYNGNTPETAQGKAYLYSLNGVGGGGGGATGTPKGTGTLDDPYNPAGVIAYINTLGADVESPQDVYIKGKVKNITEQYGTEYGNATFTIVEEGAEGTEFTVFRALYLGNKKYTSGDLLKENDEVIVCGKVVNYRGNTPETAQGKAYLYSLNGAGGGGTTPPSTDAKAVTIAEFNAASESNDVWYQLTGTVKNLKDGDKYGNFDLEDATGSVYVYGLLSEKGGEKQKFQELAAAKGIKEGSTITIIGNRGSYQGKIEVMNAYFVSIGEGGGGGQSGSAKGTGTQNDPYNAVAAANAVKNLSWTSNTEYEKTGEVYVKGKISRIASNGTFGQSGDYGNASFYISDDGSENNEFYVFRTLYLGNAKYTSGTDIKVGDEVIICGKLMNYKGNTPETVANESYIYSLNGQGGGGGGQETPSGLGTYEKPLSFAEAQKADNSEKPWAWVKAVIVGYVTGQVYATGATFGAEGCDSKTNILIAGSASANNPDNCMPVQLPNGALRTGLNLQDHPELLGKEIIIYAQLDKYFSVAGLKSPKYAEAGGNSFGTKP